MTPDSLPERIQALIAKWLAGAEQCALHAKLNSGDVRCDEGGRVLRECAAELKAVQASGWQLELQAVIDEYRSAAADMPRGGEADYIDHFQKRILRFNVARAALLNAFLSAPPSRPGTHDDV